MSDTELRHLDPGACRFFHEGAIMRVTLRDECSLLAASVLRVFPLSRPDRYFSVRDGGGKEIGVLASLEGLDPESAACVRRELERRYMSFRVTAVRRARERFGAIEWEVETNRGPCRFSTRDPRENALRLSPVRCILVDVEGNRYEVEDLAALDPHSRECLERHL